MKKIYLSCLFILFYLSSFCQEERINCIIFVDQKLPSNILNGKVEYIDSIQQNKFIDFYYETGEIRFTQENGKILKCLHDTTSITIHIRYIEYDKDCNMLDYTYSVEFHVAWLLKNSHIVFMINNLDKKKGTYNFAYSTSTIQSRNLLKKDYKLFQKICNPH